MVVGEKEKDCVGIIGLESVCRCGWVRGDVVEGWIGEEERGEGM